MASPPTRPEPDFDIWREEPERDPAAYRDLRRTLAICGGFLGVMLLLSLVVPIGAAVIGNGQVGVESHVKRIAHPFGGVIAQIAVSNGDRVRKGDLLIRLVDRVSGAQAEYSGMTVEQLLARRSRLESEEQGLSRLQFPVELTGASTATAAQAMVAERRVFSLRHDEETQLRAQVEARIEQYEQQIKGYEAQIGSLRRQRELIGPELEGVRDLWERKLVTINRLNELERTAVSLDGSIAALEANVAQSRARIAESNEQLIQLGQSRRADAAAQLAQLNTALNDQQARSISAKDMQENSEILAPYAGVVEKLAFAAVGDVVRPAEPIMEIVPFGELMVVEAAVSPTDIDQVRQGQAAEVRFTSFNLATTPQIAGKVSYVATDRSIDAATGRSYFTVRIELAQDSVANAQLALRSGMPAEVYIRTGNRPLISYLTKPLRDQFSRAFRGD